MHRPPSLCFFLGRCILSDEEGETYEIHERSKITGGIFPEIIPGKEKKFYMFFDVPKDSKPVTLKIDLIKASINFKK